MPRTAFQLETQRQAIALLRNTLNEHLSRQEKQPAIFQARPELMQHWERQVDFCNQWEREIDEQIAELRIDQAFEKSEPPATVAMPKVKRTRRKQVDYGT
jgi:hypothetical protein